MTSDWSIRDYSKEMYRLKQKVNFIFSNIRKLKEKNLTNVDEIEFNSVLKNQLKQLK